MSAWLTLLIVIGLAVAFADLIAVAVVGGVLALAAWFFWDVLWQTAAGILLAGVVLIALMGIVWGVNALQKSVIVPPVRQD